MLFKVESQEYHATPPPHHSHTHDVTSSYFICITARPRTDERPRRGTEITECYCYPPLHGLLPPVSVLRLFTSIPLHRHFYWPFFLLCLSIVIPFLLSLTVTFVLILYSYLLRCLPLFIIIFSPLFVFYFITLLSLAFNYFYIFASRLPLASLSLLHPSAPFPSTPYIYHSFLPFFLSLFSFNIVVLFIFFLKNFLISLFVTFLYASSQ